MDQPTEISQQQPESASKAVADARNVPLNPNLSAALRKDLDTIQEDLRQTKELAGNLELQLRGKS